MKNILLIIRWNKSPFTLGVLSSIAAVVLDFIWAIAEVLKMLSIVNIVFEVHLALIIGFPICAVVLIYSLILYVKNGYSHREKMDEMEHQLKQLQIKCGVIKSLEDTINTSNGRSPFINN